MLKQSGPQDFKTTIRDPTIQLTANVTLTDMKKSNALSNVITTHLQLKKLPVSPATSVSEESSNDCS